MSNIEDVSSGERNACLTKGGGVKVLGNRMKIVGDNPNVGLKLTNQENKEEVKIESTSILVNTPSEIVFIVPADLPNGDYRLTISTQFSNSINMLKNVKIYTFDYILNVT